MLADYERMKARALIFGYSWVGILNQLLLQWLFVRLQVEVENVSDRTILGVAIIYPIWPLTGWWNDYAYAGRQKVLMVWPRTKVSDRGA